ncbi:MAG: DUF547 domain-containing protein [Rhodospirillales bacterium]|nr:DUF547 domain-containing protein [Rhodospirillales bacterium]MBI2585593.1 DUF547 domain-containing protein [Rhodospirillales bacterium]
MLESAMVRIVLLLAVALLAPSPSTAAPKAELWARWLAHDPASTLAVDHGAWDRFLQIYLVESADKVNRVAYGRVGAEDKQALADYIAGLAAVPVGRLNRHSQLAFWINLYNALTIKLILDHYPVKSIQDIDISPGLFSDGPWGRKLIEVEGVAVSLDDIEHRILRPIWNDPRLHYVLNCASIGCPQLQRTAFTPNNADTLMEEAARQYVNHPRGVAVLYDRVVLSSIYKWYATDFGGDDAILGHLKRYAEPLLRAKLDDVRGIAHDLYAWIYDWTLNDAR